MVTREELARNVLKKYVKVAETREDDPKLFKNVSDLINTIHENKYFQFGIGTIGKLSKDIALKIHSEIKDHLDSQAEEDHKQKKLSSFASIGAMTTEDGKPYVFFSTGGSKKDLAEGVVFLMYLFMLIGNVKQFGHCYNCGKIMLQTKQIRKTCGYNCRVAKSRSRRAKK
ncbi:hypothetical protein ACFL0S_03945 [Thermodesulfobacteriota bacterium]